MLTNYPHTYPALNEFKKDLLDKGLSYSTLKGYVSDTRKFLDWLADKHKLNNNELTLLNLPRFMNKEIGIEYKDFITVDIPSHKTLNRHLSSLRHFAKFLVDSRSIDFDFTIGILNIRAKELKGIRRLETVKIYPGKDLVEKFKTDLKNSGASKNTVKNYVSDVRQFFGWLENN